IPFGREISEFIIGERLLRYPCQPDATSNFDSGAGLVLFEWLLQQKSGLYEKNNGLVIDVDECAKGMSSLAREIEVLETTPDDAEYRRLAKGFVRTLLAEGTNGGRFTVPDSYVRLVLSKPIA